MKIIVRNRNDVKCKYFQTITNLSNLLKLLHLNFYLPFKATILAMVRTTRTCLFPPRGRYVRKVLCPMQKQKWYYIPNFSIKKTWTFLLYNKVKITIGAAVLINVDICHRRFTLFIMLYLILNHLYLPFLSPREVRSESILLCEIWNH